VRGEHTFRYRFLWWALGLAFSSLARRRLQEDIGQRCLRKRDVPPTLLLLEADVAIVLLVETMISMSSLERRSSSVS
jgi:hypothetical protein